MIYRGIKMLAKEEYMEIKILRKQGHKIKEIAREMGISKNTVKKYIATEEYHGYRKRTPVISKLNPFKDYILNRLEKGLPHRIPASVIYKELIPLGYQGKQTLLRCFIHLYWKDKQKLKPIIRFETQPGEQMQVDWATVRLNNRTITVFIAILGFSRKAYLEFTNDQTEDTLLRCHENAFHYFGGVPRNVLYDNMKTVVDKRDCYGKGDHKLQKTLYDFAKHYGFHPMLCRPFRPQTKGKVERFVSYFKHSFYYPLITKECFDNSLRGLNFELHKWLEGTAELRFIKEIEATPFYLYQQEKAMLQAVPVKSYDTFLKDSKYTQVTVWTPNLKTYEEVGGKYEYPA
jgi:transposase